MPRSYTLKQTDSLEKLEEFHNEFESLTKEQENQEFVKYLFLQKHIEKIDRLVEGKLVTESVEYYKTTPIYLYIESGSILIASGRNYADFLANRIKNNLHLKILHVKFDFSVFFNAIQSNEINDFEPISIEINGYVKDEYILGDLSALITNKQLFLDLLNKYHDGVKSSRIRINDVVDVDLTEDFTFKIFGNLKEDLSFISTILELALPGGL